MILTNHTLGALGTASRVHGKAFIAGLGAKVIWQTPGMVAEAVTFPTLGLHANVSVDLLHNPQCIQFPGDNILPVINVEMSGPIHDYYYGHLGRYLHPGGGELRQ